MKPKKQDRSGSDGLFRRCFEQLLDQQHALCRLFVKIDWEAVEARFGRLYAEGRPGIPIQLMVGLHYLKHAFNESDERLAAV